MEVRAATPADAAASRRVVAAAFDDDGATIVRLVDALGAAGHLCAELVAEADGAVAGYVALSRSWLDARERLVEVAVLSPVAVLPAAQGHGIGTALVRAAVEQAHAQGVPALFLEGSPAFYGARGFAAAEPLGFGRPSERIPSAAFQVAVLDGHEPWMRGRLVYCEPFWALDCVGLRDPDLAVVERMFD